MCFELLARCPEVKDRQGTADLAVLNTFLEVASLSGPLRFRTEAEKQTHWRSLCPGAPRAAGETEWSPEGTEERRAPYIEVCTALPQRGLLPWNPKHKHPDWSILPKSFIEMMVLRPASSPRKTKLVEPELLGRIPGHYLQELPHRQVTY